MYTMRMGKAFCTVGSIETQDSAMVNGRVSRIVCFFLPHHVLLPQKKKKGNTVAINAKIVFPRSPEVNISTDM